jgi:hypothetical protein
MVGFWQWLDGKKTVVAAIYWSVVMPALAVLYPAGVPSGVNRWVSAAGVVLTALGLGHKWYKGEVTTPAADEGNK